MAPAPSRATPSSGDGLAEEDIDLTSGTEEGVRLRGDSLATWKEATLALRSGSQENQAVWLAWNERIALRCTHSYACSREMPRRASSSSTVPENTTPRDRWRFSRIRSG